MSFDIKNFLDKNRVTKASQEKPKALNPNSFFDRHIDGYLTKLTSRFDNFIHPELVTGLKEEILAIDKDEFKTPFLEQVGNNLFESSYMTYKLETITEQISILTILPTLHSNLQTEGFAIDGVDVEVCDDYVETPMLHEAVSLPASLPTYSSLTYILPFLMKSENRPMLSEAWVKLADDMSFGNLF